MKVDHDENIEYFALDEEDNQLLDYIRHEFYKGENPHYAKGGYAIIFNYYKGEDDDE